METEVSISYRYCARRRYDQYKNGAMNGNRTHLISRDRRATSPEKYHGIKLNKLGGTEGIRTPEIPSDSRVQ